MILLSSFTKCVIFDVMEIKYCIMTIVKHLSILLVYCSLYTSDNKGLM